MIPENADTAILSWTAAHSVQCKDCGAFVDAFDVLMEYAMHEREFV